MIRTSRGLYNMPARAANDKAGPISQIRMMLNATLFRHTENLNSIEEQRSEKELSLCRIFGPRLPNTACN